MADKIQILTPITEVTQAALKFRVYWACRRNGIARCYSYAESCLAKTHAKNGAARIKLRAFGTGRHLPLDWKILIYTQDFGNSFFGH